MLHTVANARYFGNVGFAARHVELRAFAAKFSPTVEQTVEKSPFSTLDLIGSWLSRHLPRCFLIGTKEPRPGGRVITVLSAGYCILIEQADRARTATESQPRLECFARFRGLAFISPYC
jgi:hypothetical protein